MNTVTIITVPVPEAQPAVEKFKLADNTGVLHTDGTNKTEPVKYASRAAALSAGETLFAVGEFYGGRRISAITALSDRLELTLE